MTPPPRATGAATPAARDTSLDQLCINTVRTLAMDAVQQADSGHPGTPMALAPLAYVLWQRHLRYNPANPDWFGRDRFVLSAGHACMLLYAVLYLTGYDLSLDDIKQFRQWGSRTPGHSEHGLTPGVEATTGPLGQGVGNAVGMALAEAHLATLFNRPGHAIVDHCTYFVASDGDMMEGVSHEACSLAGHLKLGKLIGIYDDNRITIDGKTDLTFSDDTARRFESYGWHVERVADGNDLGALDAALAAARRQGDRPSLVIVRTHIAYGSPHKQDTPEAHGAPLGAEEVKLTKQRLGWPSLEPFYVPEESLEHWRRVRDRGARLEAEWRKRHDTYRAAHPDLAAELERRLAGRLPEAWDADLPAFAPTDAQATRAASGKVLNAVAAKLPELIGGSADLAGSTNVVFKNGGDVAAGSWGARNIHFGVREHGMGAIMNGLALHGGVRPVGSTFLIFSDYMRPPIRLAALCHLPAIYVFTHDSIGLGEDGPTHRARFHATEGLRDRPREIRPRERAAPRRLCAGGRTRREARRHPDRERLGGGARARRLRAARRRRTRGARGQHALHGVFRQPTAGVSRRRAATRRRRPARRGGGLTAAVVSLGGRPRRRAWAGALRGVRAVPADLSGARADGGEHSAESETVAGRLVRE